MAEEEVVAPSASPVPSDYKSKFVPEVILKKRKSSEAFALRKKAQLERSNFQNSKKTNDSIKKPEDFVLEYRNMELDLIRMKRRLKRKLPVLNSDSKPLIIIRIQGKKDMHPKTRKVLYSLGLSRIFGAVFVKPSEGVLVKLKRVEPFVTYGAMSAAVVGGSATFSTTNRCINNSSHHLLTPSKSLTLPPIKKTSLQGVSLHEAKRGVSESFLGESKNGSSTAIRRRVEITARTAGAAKTIEVEVDKPLGLTLGQKPGGGVVITGVDGGGNAARAGLKAGDQVLYTSSFFGDELWPADKLGFTKTAIQAKPDSVYFVVSRGGTDVDVKRLQKRPAPPRFGRKLTDAQKARATHICLDCGYVYTLQKPFDEQPDTYGCPQCQAPKKRFAKYDVNTGKAIGGGLPPIGVIIGLVAGIGAVGALLVYGLQ